MMIIKNEFGRIVDIPRNMEYEGFNQASEVLSISEELMNGEDMEGVRDRYSAENLRDMILSKFPNVITDNEYISKNIRTEPIADAKELVNIDMKKKELLEFAKEHGIEIDVKASNGNKSNLVKYINDRL